MESKYGRGKGWATTDSKSFIGFPVNASGHSYTKSRHTRVCIMWLYALNLYTRDGVSITTSIKKLTLLLARLISRYSLRGTRISFKPAPLRVGYAVKCSGCINCAICNVNSRYKIRNLAEKPRKFLVLNHPKNKS